jgi:hypothetical protein
VVDLVVAVIGKVLPVITNDDALTGGSTVADGVYGQDPADDDEQRPD